MVDLFTGGIALVVLIFIIAFFWFVPVGLWIAAVAAGVPLRIFDLVGMRLRRVNPNIIVKGLISAHKAGLKVVTAELEAHYLAGGNVLNVVSALIAADKARIELNFQRSAAIDLAGRDVFEAVQVSVNPRVITTPKISALALDGVELIATVRITVRTNINRLVGGAGEETIIARVGEGIISAIGASETYEDVLENPDIISKTVLDRGLDAGTAFEILSIDICGCQRWQKYRRRTPSRASRGGPGRRTGEGRRAPCDGGRPEAGDDCKRPKRCARKSSKRKRKSRAPWQMHSVKVT